MHAVYIRLLEMREPRIVTWTCFMWCAPDIASLFTCTHRRGIMTRGRCSHLVASACFAKVS
jgi:hypothetical protein